MAKVFENISLKKYNSFGVDVKAMSLSIFSSIKDIFTFLEENPNKKFITLGEGSNVLFTKDYDGTVILPQIKGIKTLHEDKNIIYLKISAGENWDDIVEHTVKKGYSGLENLSLIPGTVGSCPIQNIGAYGVEVKDVIESVEVIDIKNNEIRVFENKECEFDYRSSIFKRSLKGKVIITSVTFKLNKKYSPKLLYGTLEDEIQKIGETNLTNCRKAVISIREKKLPDPKIIGNAGSFFKNPVLDIFFVEELQKEFPCIPVFDHKSSQKKISAAWLIDQCGWKGKRIGNVGIHDTQALVIVNYGNATGNEILDFSKQIQDSIFEKFGVILETEVNII